MTYNVKYKEHMTPIEHEQYSRHLLEIILDLYYTTTWMSMANVAAPNDGIIRFNTAAFATERRMRERGYAIPTRSGLKE